MRIIYTGIFVKYDFFKLIKKYICLRVYRKGDFDKAITQYMKTIGYLEPSYIIRRVWYILGFRTHANKILEI